MLRRLSGRRTGEYVVVGLFIVGKGESFRLCCLLCGATKGAMPRLASVNSNMSFKVRRAKALGEVELLNKFLTRCVAGVFACCHACTQYQQRRESTTLRCSIKLFILPGVIFRQYYFSTIFFFASSERIIFASFLYFVSVTISKSTDKSPCHITS